ncbi:hypothetical protein ES708_19115 [subsurface metagenome]
MNTEKPESEVKASDQVTCRAAGRRGGTATRDRYAGTDFYRRIGAKGGRRTAELYHDLLAEFGGKGGRPRRPALDKPAGEQDRD